MAPLITDRVQENGRAWKFTLTADRVLQAIEILDKNDILPEVKTMQAARLLVRGKIRAEEAAHAVELAFKTARGNEPQQSAGPQAISFTQDWEYICAAFLQAYGLDLEKELPRMHWRRFVGRLKSIPDSTRLAKIMEIRTRPMPKATRYNAEERAQLARLKAQYAIKSTQADMADGLKDLFGVLAARAKAGD